jgi:hypothetical protein
MLGAIFGLDWGFCYFNVGEMFPWKRTLGRVCYRKLLGVNTLAQDPRPTALTGDGRVFVLALVPVAVARRWRSFSGP